MPKGGDDVRRRLQFAALKLFRKHGYEETTAAQIAAKAGVTERTFFRYFPDKREVLFDGDVAFTEALASAVRQAPSSLSLWNTLFHAFQAVKQIFVENRGFTLPRQRVIASHPALQERAVAKARVVTATLAAALIERGVPPSQANLAAQIGMATLSHAVATWFADDSVELGVHIAKAFHEVRDLAASGTDRANT